MTPLPCEFRKERPVRTLLHGAMACAECRRDVTGWREEPEETDEGGGGVSRGPGLLMRKIVAELEGAENKSANRAELEDALCPLGFRSDNVLRSIRTLDAMYVAAYREGRFAHDSTVHLFQPVENPLTNEEVYELIKRL